MKKKISAEIVADSISEKGHRITTFLLTYPRFIHGEVMTHRLFSRNSASSRAIPFEKMVKMVEEDPFTPVAWQKDHKGMQGKEYLTNKLSIEFAKYNWLAARDSAVEHAKSLNSKDNGYDSITKQLCNRLLEPFMWHTCLITATEFSNFFELRCPKYFGKFASWKDTCKHSYANPDIPFELRINTSQAEIHIQLLAEAMWDAMKRSTPELLLENQWHIPFGDKLDPARLPYWEEIVPNASDINKSIIKISVARCARLSYMTFDGDIDYEKDIKLHDQLLESKHMSPFEHIARVPTDSEYQDNYKGSGASFEHNGKPHNQGWFDNFHGFQSYRNILEK